GESPERIHLFLNEFSSVGPNRRDCPPERTISTNDRAPMIMPSPSPSVRILVGICSSRKNRQRRDAIRRTWMSAPVNGIRCVFFVGAGDHPLDEPDTVALDCPDDYDHLPAKVIGFFTHCLENFEFDWLFKCDDDTYVALDRLGQLISPENGLIGNEFLNS